MLEMDAGRYKFCLGLRTFGRSSLLFECPEDVQRQLMTDIQAQKASRIDHIFISSLKGDNILGIPGAALTIGPSAEQSRGVHPLVIAFLLLLLNRWSDTARDTLADFVPDKHSPPTLCAIPCASA